MEYKVTVAMKRPGGEHFVHLFTAGNIQSKRQAASVYFKLKAKFCGPEYEVSPPMQWVTSGEVMDFGEFGESEDA